MLNFDTILYQETLLGKLYLHLSVIFILTLNASKTYFSKSISEVYFVMIVCSLFKLNKLLETI